MKYSVHLSRKLLHVTGPLVFQATTLISVSEAFNTSVPLLTMIVLLIGQLLGIQVTRQCTDVI